MPTAPSAPATSRRRCDNNGAPASRPLIGLIDDAARRFPDDGDPGQIRLYCLAGLAVLNRYPLPNIDAGARDELQLPGRRRRRTDQLTQQPAIRIDYQLSSKLRITGKYSGQRRAPADHARARSRASPTSYTPYPVHHQLRRHGRTTSISPTTFLEGTYGFIRNQLAGGNERRHPRQRLGVEPPRRACRTSRCSIRTRASSIRLLRATRSCRTTKPAFWDGNDDQPAAGLRLGQPHRRRAPPPTSGIPAG